MNSDIKILIVEDEKPIQRFLSVLIDGYDYQVRVAESARTALTQVAAWQPQLVLLDLGLPDGDGIELTRELRTWTQVPIIVISAREKEADKVRALDAGANDYLTKPFGSEELLARIRVALRSACAQYEDEPVQYAFGDVILEPAFQRVCKQGEPVRLTKTEYAILLYLAKNMGKVLTHKQILKEIWGSHYVEHHHYVRIHIAQLRHKLEDIPAQPRSIITENGVGYRLVRKLAVNTLLQ